MRSAAGTVRAEGRARARRVAALALLILLPVGAGQARTVRSASPPDRGTGFEKPAPELRCMAPPPLPQAPGPAPVSFRDCADTPDLIRLAGGRFPMGESSGAGHNTETPVHDVVVKGFSIGRYEVTFEEWDACLLAGGCLSDADDAGWGRGRRPVINVSWNDAQQYVSWLSRKTGRRYRLPTEAEWEYAARAGTQTRYSWGDGADWVCTRANVLDITGYAKHPSWNWQVPCDDGYANTAPVGSFEANRWGLFDMSGNVWEWVQDCWHPDYSGAPADGSAWFAGGDCGKRVNRGGGWSNHPRSMRSAARDADRLEGSGDALGFRVVREDP